MGSGWLQAEQDCRLKCIGMGFIPGLGFRACELAEMTRSKPADEHHIAIGLAPGGPSDFGVTGVGCLINRYRSQYRRAVQL